MMKIIVTGGHHNSALIIAQLLRDKGYDIVWAGHRHTMISDPHDSLEYQEVTSKNFPFINVTAGKFHSKAHLIHWLRLPWGFFQALGIMLKVRPQVVLAFGGYIAVPIAVAAKICGIPVIAFEQTTAVGRANQLISKFSRHNFLAWESSLQYFPPQKSQVVGLPLRTNIWQSPPKPWFSRSKPTLLITGGKQGSHVINQVIFQLLPQLLVDFNVIHQTGASLKTHDAIAAQEHKQKLPTSLQPWYLPQEHFLGETMLSALQESTVVVSRAGAHIVYELLALQKPAILIPLPFSYLQEQAKNAQKMADNGLAMVIPQEQLNPPVLYQAVKNMATKPIKSSPVPLVSATAAETIITYILKTYPHAPSITTA